MGRYSIFFKGFQYMGARGGSRPGAGRKPGLPNKLTADVKALAAQYGPQAIKALVEIANGKNQPAAARVSAANALLDRGFGKPVQAMEVTGKDGGPVQQAQVTVTPEQLAEAVRGVQSKF
jgi:hypothetical protein